jgi:sugar porter (SP) family MFS transporter
VSAPLSAPGFAMMSEVNTRLLRAVIASTLGGSFQFGFSTGFVNNTETFIRHYFAAYGVTAMSDEKHFNLMWSLAVSGFAMGGFLGTLAFPALSTWAGRKWSILLTTGFCYASCCLISFPTGWLSLVLGRVMVGIGAGGACATVPTFISEISPIASRGTFGTVHQLMITIGIFTAQALSATKLHLLGSDALWHYMMLVPCGCTTLLLLMLPTCAESPLHLLRSKGEGKAMEALRWYRGSVADETLWQELSEMEMELAMGDAESIGPREIVRDWTLLGPVLVGCGVNLSMQLSGIDAVLYYSTKVLQDAGLPLEWAQVFTVLVSLVNILVTIPAMLLMDKAGRKVIQSAGLGGMCVAYIIMTAALVMKQHILAVCAMFLVVSSFAFGPGCIAWFIAAELTPIHARGFATTVGLSANWIANFFVAFAFPHILVRLRSWTFSIFAMSTLGLLAFTVLCLPETKGKTALEISRSFSTVADLPPPADCSASSKRLRSESVNSLASTAASTTCLTTPLLEC